MQRYELRLGLKLKLIEFPFKIFLTSRDVVGRTSNRWQRRRPCVKCFPKTMLIFAWAEVDLNDVYTCDWGLSPPSEQRKSEKNLGFFTLGLGLAVELLSAQLLTNTVKLKRIMSHDNHFEKICRN